MTTTTAILICLYLTVCLAVLAVIVAASRNSRSPWLPLWVLLTGVLIVMLGGWMEFAAHPWTA